MTTSTLEHQPTTSEATRVGSWHWAQDVIEDAYLVYGFESDRFSMALYWFITYLFAYRYGAMQAVKVKDLKKFDPLYISKVLPDYMQHSASDLWLQLYYGLDARTEDGLELWRQGQRDIRRNQNVRNGMKAFRSNIQLIEGEAEDAATGNKVLTVFNFQDIGKSIAAWIVTQFNLFWEVTEREQRELSMNAPSYVDDPHTLDIDDDDPGRHKVRTGEVLRATAQVTPTWQESDEEEALLPADPKLVAALERFKASDPLNAALANEIAASWLPGRQPNASAIARRLSEQNHPVTHDRVTRIIQRLRRELKADREATKRQPAPEVEKEPTRAAKAAVIAPTVPEFLQAEFARTGPITESEEQAWGHLPRQHPRGLIVNIRVAELPEDTGPWYCTAPSEIEGIEEEEVLAA